MSDDSYDPRKPMPVRYAVGWWAALTMLSGRNLAQASETDGPGVVFWMLAVITVIAYGLARLGWRYGWFRKDRI